MRTSVWAVVPVKNPVDAKQRLREALSPAQREQLFRAMALDVFDALHAATALNGVVVVTRDSALAQEATQRGFEVVREPSNDGHTSAVNRGIAVLVSRGIESVLALPADLPTLSPSEIDALVESRQPAPDVVISPASDEQGSNGVLLSPPDIIELRFGDASFTPHLDKARAAGVAPRVKHLAGFGLDIDRPDDLEHFVARERPGRAYAFLESAGLVEQLQMRRAGARES
jgi:2-phospho-L-lactate/phosphoenolpyruvate guanylyltransferase